MSQRPFPWARTFILGFGFFGISIIWPLFNSLIPPMLKDLGLTAGVIGFILTWDNLINMFLQPWIGSRSDRTRTRFGRRKPYLMIGAPLAALFFILVPFVRENFVLDCAGDSWHEPRDGAVPLAHDRVPGRSVPARRAEQGERRDQLDGRRRRRACAVYGWRALQDRRPPALHRWRRASCSSPLASSCSSSRSRRILTSRPRKSRACGPTSSRSSRTGIAADCSCWLRSSPGSSAGTRRKPSSPSTRRRSSNVEVGTGTQMLTAFAAALIIFAIPSGLHRDEGRP